MIILKIFYEKILSIWSAFNEVFYECRGHMHLRNSLVQGGPCFFLLTGGWGGWKRGSGSLWGSSGDGAPSLRTWITSSAFAFPCQSGVECTPPRRAFHLSPIISNLRSTKNISCLVGLADPSNQWQKKITIPVSPPTCNFQCHSSETNLI